MVEQFNTRRHTYGVKGLLQPFPAFLGALCILGILLVIAKQVQDIRSLCGFLLTAGLVGLLGVFFIISLAVMTMFPSVEIADSGMQVQFFWFWWIFVPWASVLDLYFWRSGFRRIVVVEVDRLTPFHLVYGLIYAHKTKPAFLIASSITGYNDLIGTIGSQTGKQLDL